MLRKEMKDMKEYEMMTTDQIVEKLKIMRIKVIILRILTYGFVLLGFLFVPRNFFISMGCWIIAPVFGIPAGRAIRKRDKMKKQFRENIIYSELRNVLGDDVEYNPEGGLKPSKVEYPNKYDGVGGYHHIKTFYNGVNVELGSIFLYEEENDSEYGTKTYVRFRGSWIICDFGRKPACDIYISEKTKNSSMKGTVEINDERFGRRFCVFARDPREAFKLLTPQVMESIYAVSDKSSGIIYMSFLTDGKMHVGIDTGRNLFDVKKCHDEEEIRQKVSEELRQLMDIIDILNV